MTTPAWTDESVTVYLGDCVTILPTLPDASVDAVITDPPYDLTTGKRGGSGAASVDLTTPYGRPRISTGQGGFMGKSWDATGIAFEPETWRLVLRVLKPGAHMAVFGGTRTWHRLACAIEDAGFEIRDNIAWLYGSGFPKSLDVSKAIDKAAGAEREVVGQRGTYQICNKPPDSSGSHIWTGRLTSNEGVTDTAKQWQGWGTALKPAFEPIIIARKPLTGTVAQNVLAYGTGALNIDACRIGTDEMVNPPAGTPGGNSIRLYGGDGRDPENARRYAEQSKQRAATVAAGRWPTNVTLDTNMAQELDQQSAGTRAEKPAGTGSDLGGGIWGHGSAREVQRYIDSGGASRFFPVFNHGRWPPNVTLDTETAQELDKQSGERPGMPRTILNRGASTGRSIGGNVYGTADPHSVEAGYADSGGASRFFPVFKYHANNPFESAARALSNLTEAWAELRMDTPEDQELLDKLIDISRRTIDATNRFFPTFRYEPKAPTTERPTDPDNGAHPTVKPLSLIRWITKLICPPHGLILDPFAGTGTTAEAAIYEHMRAILIEREPDYLPLIRARLHKPMQIGFDFETATP